MISQAEKINTETKYKQKILAKIAHEFKTPLISIISLIQNTIAQHNEIQPSIKNNLNHINNLSNYTLLLISDIIQYASNTIKLVVNKNEINLNEVLEFSFNVLKTLVECNENKANKIETQIEIDQKIKNRAVVTDENRLKQILLNLISNAVKFTISGFIKIKATYNIINNSIEISVEDTGLGIKSEEHHLIFQENVQLNVEKEYNRHGSGLGLSITKSIADSLDHKIGFSSMIREGSKFYLRIKCKKKTEDIFLKNKCKSQRDKYLIGLSSNNFKSDISIISENINTRKKKDISDLSQNINNSFLTPIRNVTLNIEEHFIPINNSITVKSNDLEIITSSFTIRSNNYVDDNNFIIAVVDDNKLVRDTTVSIIKNVISMLNLTNFSIIEGSDGIDLLNLVRSDNNYRIKFIFTDENMMYLNGSEAFRIIRKLEEDDKIHNYKIISVPAFDDEETRNNIVNSGINTILSKPCSKSEILKILK